MASDDQLGSLRRAADVPVDDTTYTETLLGALIDLSGVNKAALIIWREKAAGYAKMVSMSEGGSSRSMSDLYNNAMKMVEMYQKIVADEDEGVIDAIEGTAYTVPIERV